MDGNLLFTPIKIGSVTIKNRLMRSPCVMYDADENGIPSQRLFSYYKELAIGGTGLIVPGAVYPTLQGKNLGKMAGLATDAQAESWRSTIDFIHEKGSKIIFQIADGGEVTDPKITGEQPRGPSGKLNNSRKMTTSEVEELIEKFAEAAKRAQNVGADGVSIHSSHGYMINEFLSAFFNNRDDKYGGSVENRSRILKEIAENIRGKCGKDFLIATKINGNDCCENGNTVDDYIKIIKNVKDLDFVEITCGFLNDAIVRKANFKENGLKFKAGYNLDDALKIKEATGIKTATVGGFRKRKDMESALSKGIDMISVGRPSIKDPHFAKHLFEGKDSKCVSCNMCGDEIGRARVKCFVY